MSEGVETDCAPAAGAGSRDGVVDPPSEALFGALLFAGALLPRMVVALSFADEPVWDGHYYDFGARRIAAGLGYSDDRAVAGHLVWHPWCHYPVGYSAFLAGFYRVLGATHAAAAVANALTGAALAVVTWGLARYALSRSRARAAGILVAVHPGLILYAALLMTEPLAALLTLGGFWLAVRARRPAMGIVAGSLTLGVAALVRPQALLCAPFLGLLARGGSGRRGEGRGRAPNDRRPWREAWRARAMAAMGASAIALVPVLPWSARNCRVMDGCALVSTNGGWNLAIGAFPRATGRFETLRSTDGCRDVTGQVEQDRCWLRYGLREISARPWHWLGLVPAKLGFTFDHESFAVEYLHEARPESWPEARRARARDVTTLAHRLLLAAAALGAIAFPTPRLPRGARDAASVATNGALLFAAGALGAIGLSGDSPSLWPLAVFAAIVPWLPLRGAPKSPVALRLAVSLLATTVCTHAVFFGEDRYHIVVTPVLALLAAGALRPSRMAHRTSG